jgi:hypothetical protein
MNTLNGTTIETRGYAPVSGLNMYYEIEGTGDPLVYLPPALACAGLDSFPALVQKRRSSRSIFGARPHGGSSGASDHIGAKP